MQFVTIEHTNGSKNLIFYEFSNSSYAFCVLEINYRGRAVREQNVAFFMLDGHVEFWNEAVANWVDIQLPND